MIQTINLSQFRDAFRSMGLKDQFSYEGLEVLFNGLEEYEEDTGEELDFDVIALCCDFSEMSAQEVIDAYGLDIADDGNQLNNAIDWINDQTWYVGKTDKDTIIFRQF
jgi:hypothetical protein